MSRVADIWQAAPRYWSMPIEPGTGAVRTGRFVALAGTREWLDAYANWFFRVKHTRDTAATPVQLDLLEIPA